MHLIQKSFLVFCLAIFLTFSVACHDTRDSHSNSINMTNYKGKWVIINYWATWCQPCLKELPELNNIFMIYKNKVMVLGVNYDQLSNEEINKFADKLGITFPVMRSFPIKKYGVTEINTLPVTFIISPEGKLVKILLGPKTRDSLEAVMGMRK